MESKDLLLVSRNPELNGSKKTSSSVSFPSTWSWRMVCWGFGWTTPGVLELGSISLDGDVGGVLAMTLPRLIAVPGRRLVRPVFSVFVSSVSG